MRMSTRGGRGFVAGAALAFAVVSGVGVAGSGEALAAGPDEIAVGTQLEALSSVQVSQAKLAKGSRVNVTKVVHRQGRLAGADVELADGHITQVTAATLRAFFRVVSE